MEVEFIGLDLACCQVDWLRNLFPELPFAHKPLPHISIHCNNKAIVDKAKQTKGNPGKRFMR